MFLGIQSGRPRARGTSNARLYGGKGGFLSDRRGRVAAAEVVWLAARRVTRGRYIPPQPQPELRIEFGFGGSVRGCARRGASGVRRALGAEEGRTAVAIGEEPLLGRL